MIDIFGHCILVIGYFLVIVSWLLVINRHSIRRLVIGHWSLVIVCILVIVSWLLTAPRSCEAQHFESTNYQIDWGNFNITSGKKTSTNYRLTDTVGQNAPGPYTSSSYTLKSGFQYIYTTFNKFSFTIDDLDIALGTLVPEVGSSATNIITISSPAGHGYQILALESTPLKTILGVTIPDTSCNVGATCTVTASNVWNSTTAYGFGFNAIGINSSQVATGVGTSNYFTDATYFRPFANAAANITPQTIMSEGSAVKDHSARITYRANISALQAAGDYATNVIFIAVPNY